jgi:putative addiction module component (TIGR02574 family)
MALNVEALGIEQLTVEQRLELIDLIWDSLPEQVDPAHVPSWHLAELEHRRAQAEANPSVGREWREVLDDVGGNS